ncbi:outer membrane lipoprotein-sorting protein [Fulvivirga sp. M361]|uniref:outer membrane lipoprotein-sorting protein n=1 Tax=Fulvivirga sp. M361 TaxID=2594266 RepID=UPI00117B9F3F|nr:outer membrane lipoprotein-sorting protein [Fulvivirga sp. M361]TRX60776.1 outer membrane lipoprotein-sorting protein [Fulvivirga sp. M361]
MKVLTITFVLLSAVVTFGAAQTPEEKGLNVAVKATKADEGFVSSVVDLKMILRNRQGQESERFLQNKTYELTEDGDKSMVVFNSPKDVKGTATLTYTHKIGSDDQWLYLPSIKRVKRISSSNKSGPFMGSEFAYEDLSSDEVEKYKYKYLQEISLNGDKVDIVEQYPVDPKSGYKKRIAHYNKDKGYRLEKVEFFDRKGEKLKTLTYSGYKQYLDKHWRADKFFMVNHQTGKETELFFNNYTFKTGLSEDDFNQNSLIRASR